MAFLSSAALASTTSAVADDVTSDRGQKIVQGAKDVANNVIDPVTDAVGSVGDFLGIGSSEKVRGWPNGVPRGQQQSQGRAGTAYGDASDDSRGSRTLALYPGRYNYNDLSSAGLHDKISSVQVREGYVVVLYTGVENGKPAGKKKVLKGPTDVDLPTIGMNDQVSAIAVAKRPDRSRSSTQGGGVQGGSQQNGMGSVGTGSVSGSGSTNVQASRSGGGLSPILIIGGLILAYLIYNQS